ncbi:uncharacterized protein EV154DRAFT_482168 [Mucor mucedo]|uniref:uncharacterized protein n=1 Tax=Mucor mucedo TaxID=29922 RepID=UPI00221FAB96|nr:uncharacterized protein EV154DRAFT_482168 [Mucor mucedo]KAI7890444.1 hypothetical protein EV154DRAFT_482168 [Mucor mucedo]
MKMVKNWFRRYFKWLCWFDIQRFYSMNVGSRKTLNMWRNSHCDGRNEIGQHARVTAVDFRKMGDFFEYVIRWPIGQPPVADCSKYCTGRFSISLKKKKVIHIFKFNWLYHGNLKSRLGLTHSLFITTYV